MIEFANISAIDLNTLVTAGPTAILVVFALAVALMNRVPSRVSAFDLAPSFGL